MERVQFEQRVDSHDRGRSARRAAAEPARERQAFSDRERDAARLAGRGQQRLRGDAGRIACRFARQSAGVAEDVVDADAGRHTPCRDLVAGRRQRKAEHIESARHVRNRSRSERRN